jgi:hypothetical protein
MSTKYFMMLAHLAQFVQTNHSAAPATAPLPQPKRPARRSSFVGLALAMATAAPLAAGCSATDDLTPKVVLVDHTTAPLSLGALNALNGSYGAGCIDRSGDWSSPIGGFAGGLENPELRVVKANNACVLTLGSVLIGSIKYVPVSTVTLTESYTTEAVAYKAEGDTAIAFYGNLKLSDATFSTSFAISLLFSDDAAAASAGSAQSAYKYNSISATQSSVVPPDYTVDGSAVGVLTDANKSIAEVSGSIELTDGMVTGQSYVISSVALGATPSFDAIDAAFLAGTPVTISGASPSVLASALGLVGVSLASGDIQRSVIVAHTVNNIRAYQVITLTVLAP